MLYGARPSLIFSRRCRLTYGIRTNSRAVISDPPSATCVHREKGVLYIKDVFERFVRVNQSVEVAQVVEHSFYALYKDQTSAGFDLYATQQDSGRFTTEAGIRFVATLQVDLSQLVAQGVDPTTIPIKAQLHFGRTELTFRAVNTRSGEAVATQLMYA